MLEFRQPLIVDDDEDVVVRLIATDRIIDPVAACIAAIKNDLEDPALAVPVGVAARVRGLEFFEQDAHDIGKLALLGLREMIEAGSHCLDRKSTRLNSSH